MESFNRNQSALYQQLLVLPAVLQLQILNNKLYLLNPTGAQFYIVSFSFL